MNKQQNKQICYRSCRFVITSWREVPKDYATLYLRVQELEIKTLKYLQVNGSPFLQLKREILYGIVQKNRIENGAVGQMKKWQRSSGPGRNNLWTLAVKMFANTSGMHPPAHIQTQILVDVFIKNCQSLSLKFFVVGCGL